MAKIPVTTVREALDRWSEPPPVNIHTEMTNDNGLYGASMSINVGDVEVDLLVTNVRASGTAPVEHLLSHVRDAFMEVIHAPGDATVLATEVERLTKQVEKLKADKVAPR